MRMDSISFIQIALTRRSNVHFLLSISSTGARNADLFKDHGGEPGGRQAAGIAFVVALLVHVLLYLLLPESFAPLPLALTRPEAVELELEIALAEQPEPEQLRFVEANPEVPENTPDRKDQYSFRDTQAADQSPEVSIMEAPKVDGEELSQKIIEGMLEQPVVFPSVVTAGAVSSPGGENNAPSAETAEAAVPLPVLPRLPVADFIRQSELPEDDAGSSPLGEDGETAAMREIREDAPVALYRSSVAGEFTETMADGNPTAKPVPKARPRLAPELLAGPIMKSHGSANRRGALSIDATFSEFGEYEQQFYAALQLGWYQEIEFHQPIDTASTVAVRFTMLSDGTIKEIKVMHSNASELAAYLCESALAKRSPFRAWTKEMIAVFGTERRLTVRFNYL